MELLGEVPPKTSTESEAGKAVPTEPNPGGGAKAEKKRRQAAERAAKRAADQVRSRRENLLEIQSLHADSLSRAKGWMLRTRNR